MSSHMRLDYTCKAEHQNFGVGFIYVITQGIYFTISLLFRAQGAPYSVVQVVQLS